MNTYRDNGAIGALLDEYEKSIQELVVLIKPLSENTLTKIVDAETDDEDCHSIQTILSHVVSSGYYYVATIRHDQGESLVLRNKELLNSTSEYTHALKQLMEYTEQVFIDYPDLELEVKAEQDKMLTRSNQRYNVEQLMEHAIVHILRHRRQIERFLLKMNGRDM